MKNERKYEKFKFDNHKQPRTGGGSRLATGIPLRFRLYDRGNDGARCNLPVINKFSVLVDAVSMIQSELILLAQTENLFLFCIIGYKTSKTNKTIFTLSHKTNLKCHSSRKQITKRNLQQKIVWLVKLFKNKPIVIVYTEQHWTQTFC